MPHEPQKFAAIDREVLLGLTWGFSPHQQAVDFLRRLNFLPLVTPTTYAVIKDVEEQGDEQERDVAQRVIQDIEDSDTVVPILNDTYRQVIDIHAEKLLSTGVIKGGEKVDTLILAEAAYFDAQVLLTTSKALRDAQSDSLKVALLECGMGTLFIISPKQIADYLASQAAHASEHQTDSP